LRLRPDDDAGMAEVDALALLFVKMVGKAGLCEVDEEAEDPLAPVDVLGTTSRGREVVRGAGCICGGVEPVCDCCDVDAWV